MTTKISTNAAHNQKFHEGVSVLRFFRLLSDEEQRIAYAILEGMRLQKDLDSQARTEVSTRTGA